MQKERIDEDGFGLCACEEYKKRGVCMLTFYSFLQGVFRFVKSLSVKVTKRLHRMAAVFVSAAAVITVMTLTSGGFGAGGRSSVAMAETVRVSSGGGEADGEEERMPEETTFITEAKIQVNLTDSESRRDVQLLTGSLLEEDVRKRQVNDELLKTKAEETKQEFWRREREKERIAEEKARRKAEEEARKKAGSVSLSDEDYRVLLKIVEAEAGICDDKGRILVANVILNRVKSGQFPDSVKAVVYQQSQFSPVSNGFIDRVSVSEKTKECVSRALAGEDYSQGALFL
ncbi:cell wall hydrolase [Clostridium sp. AM58-1XD]|uniref:cell wall hydrolase n=1 Tax=Clostridium sp. AM58-1XD TaxID=2292307 RepID=UPI00325AD36A